MEPLIPHLEIRLPEELFRVPRKFLRAQRGAGAQRGCRLFGDDSCPDSSSESSSADEEPVEEEAEEGEEEEEGSGSGTTKANGQNGVRRPGDEFKQVSPRTSQSVRSSKLSARPGRGPQHPQRWRRQGPRQPTLSADALLMYERQRKFESARAATDYVERHIWMPAREAIAGS